MPLSMTHTPGEWDGTFGKLVELALANMLADGEPVDVRVNGEARLVSVASLDEEGRALDFGGAVLFDVVDVDHIEVP